MGKAEEMYSLLLLSKQETDCRTSSRLLFFLSTIPLCFQIAYWSLGERYVSTYLPFLPSTTAQVAGFEVNIQGDQMSQTLFLLLFLSSLWYYYKGSSAAHQLAKQKQSLDKLSAHQRSLLGLGLGLNDDSKGYKSKEAERKTPQGKTQRVVYTPLSSKAKGKISSGAGSNSGSTSRSGRKTGISHLNLRQEPMVHTSPLSGNPMLVPQKARELGLVSFGASDEAWISSPAELERRQSAKKLSESNTNSNRKQGSSSGQVGSQSGSGLFLQGTPGVASPRFGFSTGMKTTSPVAMGGGSFSRMGMNSSGHASPVVTSPVFYNKTLAAGTGTGTGTPAGSATRSQVHSGAVGTVPYQLTPTLSARTPQKIVDDEKAYRLLEELSVSWLSDSPVAFVIEEWTDNFRRELCKQVKTVLSLLDRNTMQFKELLGDMMQPKILSYEVEETLHNEMYEGTIARAFQMCAQANNAQAHNSLNQLVQERKKLEHYLTVQRHSTVFPRGYLKQRLKALVGSGDLMPKFHWSGGESFKGMAWQAEKLPTDSEIIIHAMAAWLDDTLRTSIIPSSSGFASNQSSFLNYHMRYATTSDVAHLSESQYWGWINTTNDAQLQQTHYKVMVKGNLWEVRSGRQNVFHAIVLLLYSMKRKKVAGIEAHEKIIGGRSY